MRPPLTRWADTGRQYVDDSAVEDFGATLGKSLLNVVSWTLSSTGKSGLTPELHQELEGISKYLLLTPLSHAITGRS